MAITLDEVRFSPVSNRNEKRVQEFIFNFFANEEHKHWLTKFTGKDIQDIYALTLNQLPSRYVQPGTIVINEPLVQDEIMEAIKFATDVVSKRPKP